MDILREFFDPIPLAAMLAVAAAIAAVLVVARIFRMPPDFAAKEQFRTEVRSRVIGDRMAEKLVEEAVEARKNAGEQEVAPDQETPAPAVPVTA